MSKLVRIMVMMVVLAAFAGTTVALAADYYIVKSPAGKLSIVNKMPPQAKSVVKGPFKTKKEAEKALKAKGSAKKPVPPVAGC
jgi:hypothetical protein